MLGTILPLRTVPDTEAQTKNNKAATLGFSRLQPDIEDNIFVSWKKQLHPKFLRLVDVKVIDLKKLWSNELDYHVVQIGVNTQQPLR